MTDVTAARQPRDRKFSLDIETLVPAGLRTYGALCRWTLAASGRVTAERDV